MQIIGQILHSNALVELAYDLEAYLPGLNTAQWEPAFWFDDGNTKHDYGVEREVELGIDVEQDPVLQDFVGKIAGVLLKYEQPAGRFILVDPVVFAKVVIAKQTARPVIRTDDDVFVLIPLQGLLQVSVRSQDQNLPLGEIGSGDLGGAIFTSQAGKALYLEFDVGVDSMYLQIAFNRSKYGHNGSQQTTVANPPSNLADSFALIHSDFQGETQPLKEQFLALPQSARIPATMNSKVIGYTSSLPSAATISHVIDTIGGDQIFLRALRPPFHVNAYTLAVTDSAQSTGIFIFGPEYAARVSQAVLCISGQIKVTVKVVDKPQAELLLRPDDIFLFESYPPHALSYQLTLTEGDIYTLCTFISGNM